jgi:hypothetical protein
VSELYKNPIRSYNPDPDAVTGNGKSPEAEYPESNTNA